MNSQTNVTQTARHGQSTDNKSACIKSTQGCLQK